MKKFYKISRKVLLIVLIGLIPTVFYGQKTDSKASKPSFDPYWYVGAQAGFSKLHGDITKYKWMPDKDNWNFGFGALFGRQLTPFLGVRGNLAYGNYSGSEDRPSESWKPYYNQKVEGSYIDYSLQATFDLDNLIFSYNPDRKLGFYGILGVGQSNYRVRKYDIPSGVELASRGVNTDQGAGDGKGFGNRDLIMVVPAGLGFNYSITPKVDLTLESVIRFTDTEGMDIQSGGAKAIKQDFYSLTSLGVVYKFGQGVNIEKMQKNFGLVKFDAIPPVLETKGDSISVTIRGTFPPNYFDKKAAVCFQPVLKYQGGELPLKSVMFRGEGVQGDAEMINYKNGGTFTYKTTIPYKPEYNSSELVASPIAFVPKSVPVSKGMKCGETANYKSLVLGDRKLADGVIYTCKRVVASSDLTSSAHGYVLENILTNKGNIFFPKNKDNVNFKFGMNFTDAAQGEWASLYNYIKNSYKVKDIAINGWASPEGEETFNENLSGKRAEATKKEILKDFEKMRKDKKNPFNVPADITFSTAGNGPDWNGFMKLVESSDMKEKNTVMNVVNSADPKKKEEEIRNMILIYPQIEEKLLPPLRRAEVVVSVYEPKKTAEEIAALAISKPESLTDKELLYAASLTEDQKTQQKIYRAAAQLYPDNYRAHNNAGVIELKLGNVNEAASYFEKANSLSPDNGEVVNNLGAVAMKKGDYAKARQMFEKAKKLGVNENYNLGVLLIPEGKYDEAVAAMKGKKCDYNLALGLMLSGNTGEAGKLLDCAEKNANTYYLSAVLAARTSNAGMVFENLANAVKADAGMKATAKNDREFIKFFETPEFKKIVE